MRNGQQEGPWEGAARGSKQGKVSTSPRGETRRGAELRSCHLGQAEDLWDTRHHRRPGCVRGNPQIP